MQLPSGFTRNNGKHKEIRKGGRWGSTTGNYMKKRLIKCQKKKDKKKSQARSGTQVEKEGAVKPGGYEDGKKK